MTPRRYRKMQRVLAARQPDLTVVLDRVHKPHNIAAVMRTCDAVGVGQVHVVSPDGTMPSHHGISGGSRKWVALNVHRALALALHAVREQGMQIVAAHQGENSIDFRSVDYTQPTAILMGAELWGVSGGGLTAADRHICIPMAGMVASLNVSVAAAVVLYEAQRQRAAAGRYRTPRDASQLPERLLFEWAYPRIAKRCRDLGRAYPPLGDDGSLPPGWRSDPTD